MLICTMSVWLLIIRARGEKEVEKNDNSENLTSFMDNSFSNYSLLSYPMYPDPEKMAVNRIKIVGGARHWK